ncbi:hypothetical protein BLNAU_1444 [Blattamonas nauphoetae]|uniref:Uncharacterized protein n=1 Tax=Blattamonas nauphoetae TaxID=2049346 RepID=A0ABQ9YI18_9EUKA|nr:hypothetical protein BLNAU_1444 [Blattamonas nauphoetae]
MLSTNQSSIRSFYGMQLLLHFSCMDLSLSFITHSLPLFPHFSVFVGQTLLIQQIRQTVWSLHQSVQIQHISRVFQMHGFHVVNTMIHDTGGDLCNKMAEKRHSDFGHITSISSLNYFISTQPPCSEMNADVSVSCSGLSIDDTCLFLGTGPLLFLPNHLRLNGMMSCQPNSLLSPHSSLPAC